MAIATGVAKQLRVKRESTYGTPNGTTGHIGLRRLTSTIDLQKATYKSNEIRTDYQRSDFRHGMRSVEGTISGELSCGTYQEFFSAACRQDFQTAPTAISGQTVTIGALASGVYPITLGGGSMITSGFKVGDVVRLAAAAHAAANKGNLLVTEISSATAFKAAPVNGVALVPEGPIAASGVSFVGKRTWVPTTGHQDISFTIEHYYSNITKSERFDGCKVGQVDVNLPATGMAEVAFQIQGKDVTTANAEYFTGAGTSSTGGVLAAVNGLLYVGGVKVGNITGMNFSINANMSRQEVVGSNFSPEIFLGSVDVSGQFTALFEDVTLRDMFLNETEASLMFVLTAGNAGTDNFISFNMPRIKVGGASKDDGEKGLIQTVPFTALLGLGTGNGLATTLAIQDSTAV